MINSCSQNSITFFLDKSTKDYLQSNIKCHTFKKSYINILNKWCDQLYNTWLYIFLFFFEIYKKCNNIACFKDISSQQKKNMIHFCLFLFFCSTLIPNLEIDINLYPLPTFFRYFALLNINALVFWEFPKWHSTPTLSFWWRYTQEEVCGIFFLSVPTTLI